jgi:tetratricopeptide (TPR) repeat protein
MYAIGGDHSESIERLNRVLPTVQNDFVASSDVLKRIAEQRHRLGDFPRSCDAYAASLATMQRLHRLDEPAPTTAGNTNALANLRLELDIVIRLGSIEHELGRYEARDRHMQRARQLFEIIWNDVAELKGRFLWLETIRYRSLGETKRAFDSADKVIKWLTRSSSPALGRAYIMGVDVTVDRLLEQPSMNSYASDLKSVIDSYIKRAHYHVTDYSDPIGSQLLALTICRADYAVRSLERRPANLNTIKEVLRNVERLNDPATKGRARAVLAAEQELAGEKENAKRSYGEAANLLARASLVNLSFPPAMALNRMNHQSN